MIKQPENEELFRYDSAKVSWATDEFVRLPPSHSARAALYGIGGVLVVFLVFTYFFQAVQTVNGEGVLRYEVPPLTLTASASGRLLTPRARERLRVQTGQVLFEYVRSGSLPTPPITAPADGWISRVYVGESSNVKSGQPLGVFIPDHVELAALIEIPWYESSRLQSGKLARVWPIGISSGSTRIESEGARVSGAPFSATKDAQMSSVTLQLETHAVSSANLLFEDGMKIRASIIVGHESLLKSWIRYFFSSTQKPKS